MKPTSKTSNGWIQSSLSEGDTDAGVGYSRLVEENERWERMWEVVMNMISQVVPCNKLTSLSPEDKRSELVSSVGKLIQLSVDAEDIKKLKCKCAKLKAEANKNRSMLKEKCQEIEDMKERRLNEALRGMAAKMQSNIHNQKRLLRKWDRDDKIRNIEQRMTLDSMVPPKKRVSLHLATGDEEPELDIKKRHRYHCELEESEEQTQVSRMGRYKKTVNQLIKATNQMRRDYRELGRVFGEYEHLDSASDLSELTD